MTNFLKPIWRYPLQRLQLSPSLLRLVRLLGSLALLLFSGSLHAQGEPTSSIPITPLRVEPQSALPTFEDDITLRDWNDKIIQEDSVLKDLQVVLVPRVLTLFIKAEKENWTKINFEINSFRKSVRGRLVKESAWLSGGDLLTVEKNDQKAVEFTPATNLGIGIYQANVIFSAINSEGRIIKRNFQIELTVLANTQAELLMPSHTSIPISMSLVAGTARTVQVKVFAKNNSIDLEAPPSIELTDPINNRAKINVTLQLSKTAVDPGQFAVLNISINNLTAKPGLYKGEMILKGKSGNGQNINPLKKTLEVTLRPDPKVSLPNGGISHEVNKSYIHFISTPMGFDFRQSIGEGNLKVQNLSGGSIQFKTDATTGTSGVTQRTYSFNRWVRDKPQSNFVLALTLNPPKILHAGPNGILLPYTFKLDGVMPGVYQGEFELEFEDKSSSPTLIPVWIQVRGPFEGFTLALLLGLALSGIILWGTDRTTPEALELEVKRFNTSFEALSVHDKNLLQRCCNFIGSPSRSRREWRLRLTQNCTEVANRLKRLSDDYAHADQATQKRSDQARRIVNNFVPRPHASVDLYGRIRGVLRENNGLGWVLPSRYTLSQIVVSGLSALALAFAGYTKLYQDNPTFGANGVSDYLVVFFWGLGSVVTPVSFLDRLNNKP